MDRKTRLGKSDYRVAHVGAYDADLERASAGFASDGASDCEFNPPAYNDEPGRRRRRVERKTSNDKFQTHDSARVWTDHPWGAFRGAAYTSRSQQHPQGGEGGWPIVSDDIHHDVFNIRNRTRVRPVGVKILPDGAAGVGQGANRATSAVPSNEVAAVCRRMPAWAKFYLNILMHVSLLMTILSILFFAVIMPAERKALRSQISTGVTNVLTPLLAPGSQFVPIINKVPTPMLNNTLKSFQTPEFYIADTNDRLVALAATMCVLLWLMFLGSYLSLRFSCGFCPELVSLVLENLVTFLCVGLIEYGFFTRIALHYVPTLPSFFVTNILRTTYAILKTYE